MSTRVSKARYDRFDVFGDNPLVTRIGIDPAERSDKLIGVVVAEISVPFTNPLGRQYVVRCPDVF